MKETKMRYEKLINLCLEEIYNNDFALIFNNVSERAITHKLAEYLQKRFKGYNVDCEYNRNYERGRYEPKYLKIIRDKAIYKSKKIIENEDLDSLIEVSTYPDIIIHKRLSNKRNLIAIEVKKDINNDIIFDIEKITAFTSSSDENDYKYMFGVLIEIPVKPYIQIKDFEYAYKVSKDPINKPKLRWFQDGKEI